MHFSTIRCLALLFLVLLRNGSVLAVPIEIVYPSPESKEDHRYDYYWELLRVALDKTVDDYGPYTLRRYPLPMTAARAETELERDTGTISLFVRATSEEREQRFLPVRIPLDKGLLGYRIFLIRKELQPRLDTVANLQQLRSFTIGQGAGWIDVPILTAAGFQVVTGTNYEGMFRMLAAARFDLFPRGVTEVISEYEDHKRENPGLAIERHLILYYPLPRYFFLARTAQGRQLAARIEAGLEKMLADGTFDHKFDEQVRPLEKAFNLKSRRILRIDNPTLPPETPLKRKELWYDPARGR